MPRHQSIQVDKLSHSPPSPFGRATNDHATIGMSDQYDIVEVVHFQHAGDIGDMGIKINRGTDQMRAVAQTRERYGERSMAGRLEEWHKLVPAPATVPGAMDENEG